MLTVGCSRVYVCGARRALLAICVHLTLSDLTYLNFLFYSHWAPSPQCTKNTCTALQGVQKESNHHVPSDRLYISAAVLYVPVCVRFVRCMFTAALQSLSTSSIVSWRERNTFISFYFYISLHFQVIRCHILLKVKQPQICEYGISGFLQPTPEFGVFTLDFLTWQDIFMHLCISLTREIVPHLAIGDCGRLVKSLCVCFAICRAFICLHPISPRGAKRFWFFFVRRVAFCMKKRSALCTAQQTEHAVHVDYTKFTNNTFRLNSHKPLWDTHTSDGHGAPVTSNSIPPGHPICCEVRPPWKQISQETLMVIGRVGVGCEPIRS